jgi:hypothetical protein
MPKTKIQKKPNYKRNNERWKERHESRTQAVLASLLVGQVPNIFAIDQ